MPKIITRQAAIERGLNRYFSGEPCKHGHIGDRFTVSCTCVDCDNLRHQRQRELFAARKSLEKQAFCAANPHVISRATAIERGLKRYCTGLTCKWGHAAERFVVSRGCVECYEINETARKTRAASIERDRQTRLLWRTNNVEKKKQLDHDYYERNKEKMFIQSKRWRQHHPTKWAEYQRKYRANHLEKIKAREEKARRAASAALRALRELGIEV